MRRHWTVCVILAVLLLNVASLSAQTVWLSQTTVNFGSQAVLTTSAAKTVRLTNTGTAPLLVSSITPPSAPFADPKGTGACPSASFSLAPGSYCTISVTFSPATTGTFTGSISITDNAPGSPQTISLKGKGVPQATLSTTNLTFGNEAVGNTAAKTITLYNNLNTSLTFSGATASGSFGTTTAANNPCGTSVPAGGQCSIGVIFTPTALGALTGTLTVTDSANNTPQTATLTGTGVAQATLSSTTGLNFENHGVGTTATQTITLYNDLNTSLTFTGATASGDFATTTAPTNPCGASVPAGGHCSIGVTFTPAQLGTRTGTLTVTDSASNSPQTATLTGTGTTSSVIGISVTPANPAISTGANEPFTATGSFPLGITLNLTSLVTWSSSSTKVATISSTGVATGVAAGTTTIRAALNEDKVGSTLLTVTSGGLITPTISWTPASPITYGTPLGAAQLDATASAGGTTVPGNFAYTQAAGAILSAGTQTLSVTFTPTDPTHYTTATASASLTVTKSNATVTLGNLTLAYTGSALTPTATTVPAGLAINWTGAPDTNAGTYAVTATVNDPNYAGSASGSFVINKGTATVVLGNLTQAYTGSALTPTATTVPAGLAITWTGAPDTNAGTYPVTATVNDPNSTGSASGSFVISKGTATVTLSNLTQMYTGSGLTPTVVTVPAGLAITWTGAPDTNTGTYPVTATISDLNYTGSASGSFVISKGTATVTLSNLTQTYTGSGLTPTAVTVPAGLAITWTGAPTTNAGTYPVTATINDPNYAGSASGSFVVNPGVPTITVTGGTFTYDGNPHPASAVATGIGGVPVSGSFAITYNGSTTAPLTAGTYPVSAAFTSSDPNYSNGIGAGAITISAPSVTLVSIAVTPGNASVPLGTTQQFTATGTNSDGSTTDLSSSATWTVSAAGVATISPTGLLTTATTGCGGPMTVTATSVAVSGSTMATVTVIGGSTCIGDMTQARDPHTATLLDDGTVLIAGGLSTPSALNSASNTAEYYSPVTGVNYATALPMNSAHAWHTATYLHDGTVLIAGGVDSSGSPTTSAEIYNPLAKTFTSVGGLHYARYQHTATVLLDGTVLIAGGWGKGANGAALIDVVETYDPVTQTFTVGRALSLPRYGHTSTLLLNSGEVMIAGGADSNGVCTSSTEIYLNTGISPGPNMTLPRCNHTATGLTGGNDVLFVGGTGSFATYTDEVFHERGNVFAVPGNGNVGLSIVRSGHTATLLPNGKVYVAGGNSYIGTGASAELLDPTSSFTSFDSSTGSLFTARVFHTATYLSSIGKVLITGGTGSNGLALSSQELYTPTTSTIPTNIPFSITIGPTNPTIAAGNSWRFVAFDLNASIDNQPWPGGGLYWTSSDSTVATVGPVNPNGASTESVTVTAVAAGSVTISACGTDAAGQYVCGSTSLTVQ